MQLLLIFQIMQCDGVCTLHYVHSCRSGNHLNPISFQLPSNRAHKLRLKSRQYLISSLQNRYRCSKFGIHLPQLNAYISTANNY
ncbi:hypothetical protein D3C78_1302090 [compost metagenome]